MQEQVGPRAASAARGSGGDGGRTHRADLHGDHDLSVVFREDADESSELGDMHFVRGLNGLVEHLRFSGGRYWV